jgi:hypothetical protein
MTGEAIFWKNAQGVLRDIRMPHLDPSHGAAVEAVRWCRLVKKRPTYNRQAFLEKESPALLAYLETLASIEEFGIWRTLDDRIRLRALALRSEGGQTCARPWLAATWHTLPELSAIGELILDQRLEPAFPNQGMIPMVHADQGKGNGGDESGGGDKTGSAGSTAMPNAQPPKRLKFLATPVLINPTERKAFGLDDEAEANDENDNRQEGPDERNRPVNRIGGVL